MKNLHLQEIPISSCTNKSSENKCILETSFALKVGVLGVTGIGVVLGCSLLVSMVLSNIDISSGVLVDVNLGEVTVFTFVCDLLLMIHELLLLTC